MVHGVNNHSSDIIQNEHNGNMSFGLVYKESIMVSLTKLWSLWAGWDDTVLFYSFWIVSLIFKLGAQT
jgi:hypothetical protein